MKTFNEFLTESVNGGTNLNESSMTRFISKFKLHDAVIITAFRDGVIERDKQGNRLKDDDGKYVYSKKFTKAENKARNKELFSALFAKGYSITKVKGSYIENYQEVDEKEMNEESFVVVNQHDKSDFLEVLEKLGRHYDQDSILVIKGGDSPTAYLLGTNDAEFPGLGKKVNQGSIGLNKFTNVQFFTKLGNAKFFFADKNVNMKDPKELSEYRTEQIKNGYPDGSLGRMACSTQGKQILESIGIEI